MVFPIGLAALLDNEEKEDSQYTCDGALCPHPLVAFLSHYCIVFMMIEGVVLLSVCRMVDLTFHSGAFMLSLQLSAHWH